MNLGVDDNTHVLSPDEPGRADEGELPEETEVREERDGRDEGEKSQAASGTDIHIAEALDFGT